MTVYFFYIFIRFLNQKTITFKAKKSFVISAVIFTQKCLNIKCQILFNSFY
jgi:hypothetical protein